MFWLQNDLSQGTRKRSSVRERQRRNGWTGGCFRYHLNHIRQRQTKTDKEEEVNDNYILTLSALLESRKNVIIPSGIFSKVLPLICLHFNTFASKVTQFPHHVSISSSQVVSSQRCLLPYGNHMCTGKTKSNSSQSSGSTLNPQMLINFFLGLKPKYKLLSASPCIIRTIILALLQSTTMNLKSFLCSRSKSACPSRRRAATPSSHCSPTFACSASTTWRHSGARSRS